MSATIVPEEKKKARVKVEKRAVKAVPQQQKNIRPHVAALIDKVLVENAPTWKELAKR
jgi:hypothetical protein